MCNRLSADNSPDLSRVFLRSILLFANFFLIIMALYHLKPASRSLILESHGSSALPYIWIGSALSLLIIISIYHHILNRFGRLQVVLGTCLTFCIFLILFRLMLISTGKFAPVAFYIFVDILGVILVEQFWSLANSVYSTEEGKRWYGIVGTGGLIGGMVGGGIAAMIVSFTPLQTPDLLLVAVLIIAATFALTIKMARMGLYIQAEIHAAKINSHGGWQALFQSHYLVLIAGALLIAQLVSPLVEYQFLRMIEGLYPDREERTAVLSVFFSILSGVSIAVNLVLTPLVLRYVGVLAGLLTQPLILATATYGFLSYPGLLSAATMKISDRGLSYSINRAAKELLYIPVDPTIIYQAKAWIDMFGYRIFKVLGSMLILLLTQWSSLVKGYFGLSVVIIFGCMIWVMILLVLHREYKKL